MDINSNDIAHLIGVIVTAYEAVQHTATHNGVQIYTRYHRHAEKYQYIVFFGNGGYNSAFVYKTPKDAHVAAREKINKWQGCGV
jgi:hypothetical protein